MNESNTENQNDTTQSPANPDAAPQNPYLLAQDQFGDMIYTMSKDMKFLGIMSIIFGILYCLSILGAIIGVPLIFAGIRLKESGESFDFFSKNNDEIALQQAIERQKRFFYILKMLVIVYISITVLVTVFCIVLLFVFLTNVDVLNELFNEFQ